MWVMGDIRAPITKLFESAGGRLRLGHSYPRFSVQRLALKVRQFDGVVVNDPDATYARNATHARAQRGGKCIIIKISRTVRYIIFYRRSADESQNTGTPQTNLTCQYRRRRGTAELGSLAPQRQRRPRPHVGA